MDNEKNSTSANTCICRDDLRTLIIALLTTIIVLAFYHIGMGLCRMNCGPKPCGGPMGPAVCQSYILVPVGTDATMYGHRGMHGERMRKEQAFGAKRGESRKFFKGNKKANVPGCPGAICSRPGMTPDGTPGIALPSSAKEPAAIPAVVKK